MNKSPDVGGATNGRQGGPTDAQVIAGAILGIAGMFANGRRW